MLSILRYFTRKWIKPVENRMGDKGIGMSVCRRVAFIKTKVISSHQMWECKILHAGYIGTLSSGHTLWKAHPSSENGGVFQVINSTQFAKCNSMNTFFIFFLSATEFTINIDVFFGPKSLCNSSVRSKLENPRMSCSCCNLRRVGGGGVLYWQCKKEAVKSEIPVLAYSPVMVTSQMNQSFLPLI